MASKEDMIRAILAKKMNANVPETDEGRRLMEALKMKEAGVLSDEDVDRLSEPEAAKYLKLKKFLKEQ